jgi:hypothetical protein
MAGSPNGISGQVASLSIDGVGGSFGVTKITAHKNYTNAETTITQNYFQQYCPIVIGCRLEVEVPLSTGVSNWIDAAFEQNGEFNTSTAAGLTCSLESSPAGGEVYSGCGLIEDYKVTYDAKDAARVTFTILFTGEVSTH